MRELAYDRRGGRLLWCGGAALLVSSCSLAYDLSGKQCTSDADCDYIAQDLICRHHVCQEPTPAGGASTGGRAGTGGAGGIRTGGAGGVGKGGAGGVGTGGAGTGGAGGVAGAPPECETNAQCIEEHLEEPYICQRGKCVKLKAGAVCPVVLGAGENKEFLKTAEPIIVGAWSNFGEFGAVAVSTYNYELAFEEFNEAGGLPGPPRRPVIAVVCNAYYDVHDAVDHLVDDLEVPGVLATLQENDLKTAFEYTYLEKEAQVLFISPFPATAALRNINDDGLLWHLLGSDQDIADTFVPLMERAENFQNRLRPDPEQPLRVLQVESPYGLNEQLGDLVPRSIQINGSLAVSAANAENFRRVEIESADQVNNPDVSAALSTNAFDPDAPPHVVIALAGREFFTKVIDRYEEDFNEATGQPRPLYLLSPVVAGESVVQGAVFRNQQRSVPLSERMVGVNFATVDSTLYDNYLSSLKSRFSNPEFELEGTENYYDAAYFLLYSFAAAGDLATYDGFELYDGMKRLVREDVETDPCVAPTCFTIDSTTIDVTTDALRNRISSMGAALVGTLGPPNFYQGVRYQPTSAWCVTAEPAFLYDVLEYDVERQELVGEFPCFDGF